MGTFKVYMYVLKHGLLFCDKQNYGTMQLFPQDIESKRGLILYDCLNNYLPVMTCFSIEFGPSGAIPISLIFSLVLFFTILLLACELYTWLMCELS